MAYQLNSNLQRKAVISAAIAFWEQKEVKDTLIEFLSSCGQRNVDEAKVEWKLLTKKVFDKWYRYNLPTILHNELIHIVKEVGKKIFNWYQYIKHEHGTKYKVEEEAINYLDKICWTAYGTVDEVQILKTSWLENPSLNVAIMYNVACKNLLEEHVNDLWQKMPKDIRDDRYKDLYDPNDRYNDKCEYDEGHMLAYWKYRRDGNLRGLINYFESVMHTFTFRDIFHIPYFVEERSTENSMLRLAVHEGHSIATKYFWDKITEEERSRHVIDYACLAVRRFYYYEKRHLSIGDYKKDKYVEICVFMINQMTEEERALFLGEERIFVVDYDMDRRDGIMRMLLSGWPWHELFIPVFKDVLKYGEDDSKTVRMVLDKITEIMLDEDHKVGYDVKNSTYQSLLHEAWLIIPESIKQKMIQEDSKLDFICNLIKALDFDSLKMILDDPEIEDVRNQYIKSGSLGCVELIKIDKPELFDRLMTEIFKPEEEEKRIALEVKVLEESLASDRFDLADRLLFWQSDVFEKDHDLICYLTYSSVCVDFVKKEQYDLADKGLNWYLGSEQLVEEYKDAFKNSSAFTIEWIIEIWQNNVTNIKEAMEKSDKFLNWLLTSEDEIARFKKDKIINSETKILFINFLIDKNLDGVIKEFLLWCLLSTEDIRQMEEHLSQEFSIENWLSF